jgi:hypothetical protein
MVSAQVTNNHVAVLVGVIIAAFTDAADAGLFHAVVIEVIDLSGSPKITT